MSPDKRGALVDGRLNLEQQRKRAKELLRAYAAGGAEARRRFAAHHRRAGDPKLADAQFVIARENGFESWPRLKAHTEALARARAAMDGKAPDTAGTLHLRCGSDIRRALRRAGFVGTFHEFSDPFCHGPVRDLPRDAFIEERARFLTEAYGLTPEEARAWSDGYAIFGRLAEFEEIVLWFEHDSYDQLILAFLLGELGQASQLPPVHLICAEHIPGVSRFIGLGQLSPEVIRWLWSSRHPVGAAELASGAEVFAAVRAPSPERLLSLARRGTPLVPPMARALTRHLQELPSTANGLSLTEQLALEILAERGSMDARELFSPRLIEREPLPFLGDAMFWHVLDNLAVAARPAIHAAAADEGQGWPRRRVSLTDVGRALLAGEIDWLACGPRPRFVGGVELAPGEPSWRFDRRSGSVRLVRAGRPRASERP